MEILLSLVAAEVLQPGPVLPSGILVREFHIIEKSLNVEAGSSYNNRDPPSGQDIIRCLHGKLAENHDIKGLRWSHDVDQVVGNSHHLVFHDLSRSDVHPPVDLHGIGTDDLPADILCQTQGNVCLARRRRSGDDYQWFLHV